MLKIQDSNQNQIKFNFKFKCSKFKKGKKFKNLKGFKNSWNWWIKCMFCAKQKDWKKAQISEGNSYIFFNYYSCNESYLIERELWDNRRIHERVEEFVKLRQTGTTSDGCRTYWILILMYTVVTFQTKIVSPVIQDCI